MTLLDISQQRLINQQIDKTKISAAKEIVEWMGAMQAQDYAMAKWALGHRLSNATDKTIEDAINRAEIVRTHVMRPTWHFVSAKDIRWMLALTAPHIISSVRSMQKKLGLNDVIFNRTNKIIEKSLTGNKNLTRTELMTELKKNKIVTNSLQAIHIMFEAEQKGIVCNGPMRSKQFTYALMDERIPKTKPLTRNEALVELSKRYFTSHGPATVLDFIWWSGLPAADAKIGLEMVKQNFTNQKIADEVYWFTEAQSPGTVHNISSALFLPAYDEFIISYKDRTASLEPRFTRQAVTNNGIFKPMIVAEGRVVGLWNRVIKKDRVIIKANFFRASQKLKKKDMEIAAQPLGKFLNLKVEIS